MERPLACPKVYGLGIGTVLLVASSVRNADERVAGSGPNLEVCFPLDRFCYLPVLSEISQMTDSRPGRTIASRKNTRNEPRTHTRCINRLARACLLRLILRESIAIASGSPVSLRTPPSTRLDSGSSAPFERVCDVRARPPTGEDRASARAGPPPGDLVTDLRHGHTRNGIEPLKTV